MSLRNSLFALLSRFDEEAFAALANRGLVRRAQKDLEKFTASISEENDSHLQVEFAEQSIRFDARGPAHAQCSCPASGICQHILAAAMALQRLDQAADAQAPSTPEEPTEPGAEPLAVLEAELLAVPQASLLKHAGKAGYRWAWQFAEDLDLEKDLSLEGERNLVMRFQYPRLTLRYMGGGLDGLVADTQISQFGKYQLAAVLALRRLHGLENPPPEQSGKARTGALNLGQDHALPETASHAQQDSRGRLRASLQQVIEEAIALGLSHLSASIQERFATLAVWAQGAEYYRLALLLRRIADHIELLLERAGGADERRLLDELAIAYALVQALEVAASKGLAPKHLLGQARSRYEDAGRLQLLGLGAVPWRSASGYLGLTLVFWSAEEQMFHTCTDARPEMQHNFNPRARYTASGPWSGLSSPQQATGQALLVSKALLNDQGRLSATENTSASLNKADNLAAQLRPYTSWAELATARANSRKSLLSTAQLWRDWVALAPADWGRPTFDENRQVLSWPLLDQQERCIYAGLPFSDLHAHAIQRIEQLSASDLAGSLLIARLRGSAANFVAEPLSLVRTEQQGEENPVDALHFDGTPTPRQAPAKAPAGRQTARAYSDNHPPLTALRSWLLQQAERGYAGPRSNSLQDALKAEIDRLGNLGYSAFSKLPEHSAGAALLAAYYICLQYERLLGVEEVEV